MEIMVFNASGLKTIPSSGLETALQTPEDVVWIDVQHPDKGMLSLLGDRFNFHPLAVEDTYNEHQRPKVEEYPDHLFIIINQLAKDGEEFEFRELDIFLGENYIVTVHEKCQPLIAELRKRLSHKMQFKHVSSEYLLYLVLDTVVDAYFPILSEIDEAIETISEQILDKPDQMLLQRIFQLRRTLNELWRVVGQQRDMFSTLARREDDLLRHHDKLTYYLRDVHDHLIRISDSSILLRDHVSNLVDLYMTATSNRLNIVVNRLTVITIIIGIMTVISGFYGMNFERTFPPFSAEWGVPFTLGLMLLLATGTLAFFKWMKFF